MNKWKYFWWWVKMWLSDNSLTMCGRCGRYILEKNAHREFSTVGQVVVFCPDCHEEMFNLFYRGLK